MSQAGIANSSGSGGSSITFDEDIGSATPAGGILNIVGGSGISTSGTGNTVTITATGGSSDLTFATDSTPATSSGGTITFHGTGGLLFSGAVATVTGALANIPNASLQNSTITLPNSTNLTWTTSPVALGGSTTVSLNAQIKQPDGSAPAPSYSFSNDPTSGMYWNNGSGVINFSLGGSSTVRFGSGSAVFDQSQVFMQSLQTGGGRVVHVEIKSADYAALSSDYFLGFDTTAARNLTLPGSPSTGQTYRVADVTGGAASFNITITGNGHNVDGAATFVMNVAYGSIDLTYTGTIWKVS